MREYSESYRSTFEQPKLDPGLMRLKIPGAFEIEVYREPGRDKWKARFRPNGQPLQLQTRSLRDACLHIQTLYERQLTKWSYHRHGELAQPPREAEQIVTAE